MSSPAARTRSAAVRTLSALEWPAVTTTNTRSVHAEVVGPDRRIEICQDQRDVVQLERWRLPSSPPTSRSSAGALASDGMPRRSRTVRSVELAHDGATSARLPCSVRSMTAIECPLVARSATASARRSGLRPRCRCRPLPGDPAAGRRKLHRDCSCQPLAGVGTAAVEGPHVRQRQPPFRGSYPADADRYGHLKSGRDLGSPTKPVRDNGEEQHQSCRKRRRR